MGSICKLPWAGFSNDPNGTVRPCCIYKGHITKEDGSLYYVQKDSVKDIFHSDYMNDLRAQFLRGEKPKGCETCWIDESNGYQSKREIYNNIFSSQGLEVSTETVNEYPIDYQIIISNACNLKCRSCGTSHSTQWQKEINNLPEVTVGTNDYVHKFLMPHGQPGGNDSIFLKDLENWVDKVKRLEIVGGEPFYIEKWKTILELLIEKGYSSKIDLAMSSNASIFNEELLTKICKNFRAVGIGLSVDGMGEMYEYLRKNGDWEETRDNCYKYYEVYKKLNKPGVSFNYTYTISWINAYRLPEFHDWVKENTPEFRIWNNIVHYPNHMSITMLPSNEKQRIEDKWKNYNWGKYQSDIDSVIRFMWSKEYSDKEIKAQYGNFIFFDHVRGESTYEIVKQDYPSLYRFFNE